MSVKVYNKDGKIVIEKDGARIELEGVEASLVYGGISGCWEEARRKAYWEAELRGDQVEDMGG